MEFWHLPRDRVRQIYGIDYLASLVYSGKTREKWYLGGQTTLYQLSMSLLGF